MDLLDLFLAVSTAAVVVAALLFPINRPDDGRERKEDPKDVDKSANERSNERSNERARAKE